MYHLFIQDIRKTQYGYLDEGEIPNLLRAVSWNDGAHAQLNLIPNEESLAIEDNLKIDCN